MVHITRQKATEPDFSRALEGDTKIPDPAIMSLFDAIEELHALDQIASTSLPNIVKESNGFTRYQNCPCIYGVWVDIFGE